MSSGTPYGVLRVPRKSSESLESPHKVLTKSSQSLHKVPTKSPHSPHKVLRVPTKSLVSLWFCCTLSEDFVGTLWGLCEDSQDHSRLGHFWALWGLCRDFVGTFQYFTLPHLFRSDSDRTPIGMGQTHHKCHVEANSDLCPTFFVLESYSFLI